MLKITVPATSANLGSGFDCAGVALSMENTVYMDFADRLLIESLDGTDIPIDKSNLVFDSAQKLFERAGAGPRELHIKQINQIPMARGLGSSAACIVAGILGANTLLGDPLSRQELLEFAVELEGHPDNALPAILGGVAMAAVGADGLRHARFSVDRELVFAAFIPPFPLETKVARAAMPKVIPLADAVHNLSRSALLAAAFATGDYSLLRTAAEDRLHQPYRLGLIPGSREVMAAADRLGALATFISGAGSTIMSIVERSNRTFFDQIEGELAKSPETAVYSFVPLEADNSGAKVAPEPA